jgi:hypothetical protein
MQMMKHRLEASLSTESSNAVVFAHPGTQESHIFGDLVLQAFDA